MQILYYPAQVSNSLQCYPAEVSNPFMSAESIGRAYEISHTYKNLKEELLLAIPWEYHDKVSKITQVFYDKLREVVD